MDKRARRFCITQHDINFNYDKVKKECSYIIVGDETCPTTKKKHHQIYIEFKNAKSLKSIVTKFNKSHTEIAKGDSKSNIAYCSKEKVLFTEGTAIQVQGQRNDLLSIKEELDNGVSLDIIADQSFKKWVMYRKAFQEYKEIKEEQRNWVTEVIVIVGEPGTGKTRIAIEDGAIQVYKTKNFIGGYNGEDIVLFDDVDKETFTDRQTWLQLLDRYPMKINIKGGFRNWKPRKIYITSNYSVDELFFGDLAFLRRITEIKILSNIINAT